MEKTEIKKYNTFIFDKFNIEYRDNFLVLEYYYEIEDLTTFKHIIEIPYSTPSIDHEFVRKLAFNIGFIEMINYWKATMSKNVIIKCGALNIEQEMFFKKTFYNGLGEFLYRNDLSISNTDFMQITYLGSEIKSDIDYDGVGNIIGIGGGKDSCVTLELLKNEKNNYGFIVNSKEVNLECAKIAECQSIISIKRVLDKNILSLNERGFFNGHIPFSGILAFISFLAAYLNNKKNIILSNEASANEANIKGTSINHQYSKSYEFELDFQNYAKKYLNDNIYYFSLLRGLSEYQIGMLFSQKCKKYFKVFKSCNVGSKKTPWKWCCSCAKCLFVYSLLSPFLYKDELIAIFGEDLFEKQDLLETFKQLLGKESIKPFDCVGTFEEVNYAIMKTISNNNGELPYLLQYYKDNYYDEKILDYHLEEKYNEKNSLSDYYNDLVRSCIENEE